MAMELKVGEQMSTLVVWFCFTKFIGKISLKNLINLAGLPTGSSKKEEEALSSASVQITYKSEHSALQQFSQPRISE